MGDLKIQKIWRTSFADFFASHNLSDVQLKASNAIINCKSGSLGFNVSKCSDCGHIRIHNNSCRNRSCPNCQAVSKEIWVDKRRAEVIDAPYFHVVFTLPHELNPLFYSNQRLLYGILHQCCSQTLIELSRNSKYLGATPGIIQILHTWNQELDYHVHMHCIVSGAGLTNDFKIKKSKHSFFIPVFVLRDKFKGKFLASLRILYASGKLNIPDNPDISWDTFIDSLYKKDWCPYIKETFNGFGNAIEYLGRYTNKIAISNSRIISVSDTKTVFSARAFRSGEPRRIISLSNEEFIRRYLLHVLPFGFQKIRYYGFLGNSVKSKCLRIIFEIQGHQRFRRLYSDMTTAQLVNAVWKIDIYRCPVCGHSSMRSIGRTRCTFS